MQEADEQDTCRICSAPAEADQPLFHPCKCSGTIRYIHQDCLTTWLAHSKKKSCDVCKHPYSFTKVYAPDMPSSLPPVLLVRRLLQHAFIGLLFVIRALAVALIWLGVLPWVTVWTWRMYFAMGETTAWWVSNRPRPSTHSAEMPYSTIPSPSADVIWPPAGMFPDFFTKHPMWISLSADIFTGQIIASLIVLIFVAVFLLREWIAQNARPGVFEDEEELPENRPAEPVPAPALQLVQPHALPQHVVAQPQLPQPAPNPQLAALENNHNAIPLPEDEYLADGDAEALLREVRQRRDQARVMRAHANAAATVERTDRMAARARNYALDGDAVSNALNEVIQHQGDSGSDYAREGSSGSSFVDATTANDSSTREVEKHGLLPRRTRRRVALPHDGENEDERRYVHLHSAEGHFTSITANQRAYARQLEAKKEASSRRDPLLSELRRDPLLYGPAYVPHEGDDNSGFNVAAGKKKQTDIENPFPTVVLEPVKSDIPFSLRDWKPPANVYPPLPTPPVRPSLAATSTPFTFSMNVPAAATSPNLASYRAPEEMQGPPPKYSLNPGYFGGADKTNGLGNDGASRMSETTRPSYPNEEGPSRAKRIGTGHVEADPTDPDYVGRNGTGVKRRQLAPNPYSIKELSEDSSDDDMDVDMEAEHHRYFRNREEERNPVGLNLDMDAFRRDFPDQNPDSEGNGSDSDRPVIVDGDDLPREGDMDFPVEDEEEEEEHEVGDGFFDDDGPWEDVDEEEEEEGIEGAQPLPGGIDVQPQLVGEQEPVEGGALEVGDEGEANVEDEMDGILEAIGLRGPLFGVFQNAALMIFVLDTAIGIGIWIPFSIGKTTALLSLDPRRLMEVLHLPIRAMRLVTDPIVDTIVYIVIDCVGPVILKIVKTIVFVVGFIGWNILRALLGNKFAASVSDMSTKIAAASTNAADGVKDFVIQFTTSASGKTAPPSNGTLLSSIPDYLGFTEPYFEALGREVRVTATKAQSTWIDLALGDDASNRVFAVALGYIVAGFVLCIYLNLLTVGNARTAGIAVRNAVRQQLLVLKVAAFIFIELVTFPLGCGIVLDLCTVWMFPEVNLQTRVAFFTQAPLTAMFYHWIAGTMFMYSFAVLLSGCRSVMRPGAMWFIKDPQDQNSHPIRDILDRPTFTQLRKICVSGLMYTFVVACAVGSVAGLLMLGNRTKSVMPIRWKKREPLSNVPVDLLFLHLVLPYTMHYFRPKRLVKTVATVVWKLLATRLRLTSYFFGGRYPIEEFTPYDWMDNFVRGDHVLKKGGIPDGGFRRVPATDNLSLPRDMRATAAVNADGVPVDEEAKKLMEMQNAEAEKGKKNIAEDYTIVYMPPNFKYRIITFITLLWIVSATLFAFSVGLPVVLGRAFFSLFTAREVHDGYALIAGFYLVWTCYLIAKAVDRLDRRRQRRSGDGPRPHLYVIVLKRGLLWASKITYMALCLGVVIPILLATVVDLYMILPIRLTRNSDMIPRIRIVDEWALGLLYSRIMLHTLRFQQPSRITRGLANIMQRGFTHPDPVLATREVIMPLIGGLLGMIIFPGAVFRTLQHFLPDLPVSNRFIFTTVYPGVFIVAAWVRSAITLLRALSAWSLAIRDKEFLVEMRLKNHEPNGAATEEEEDGRHAAIGGVPGVVVE